MKIGETLRALHKKVGVKNKLGRRTAGLIEEAAQVPGQILSEVVIPRRKIMGLPVATLVE